MNVGRLCVTRTVESEAFQVTKLPCAWLRFHGVTGSAMRESWSSTYEREDGEGETGRTDTVMLGLGDEGDGSQSAEHVTQRRELRFM